MKNELIAFIATALEMNPQLGVSTLSSSKRETPERLIPNPEKQEKAEVKRQRKLERNRRSAG